MKRLCSCNTIVLEGESHSCRDETTSIHEEIRNDHQKSQHSSDDTSQLPHTQQSSLPPKSSQSFQPPPSSQISQPSQGTVQFNQKVDSALDVISQLRRELEDLKKEREEWRKERKLLEQLQNSGKQTADLGLNSELLTNKTLSNAENIKTTKKISANVSPERASNSSKESISNEMDRHDDLMKSKDSGTLLDNKQASTPAMTANSSRSPSHSSDTFSEKKDSLEDVDQDKDIPISTQSPELNPNNSPKENLPNVSNPDLISTNPEMSGKKDQKALSGFPLFYAENHQDVAMKEAIELESELREILLDIWRHLPLEEKVRYSKSRCPKPKVVNVPRSMPDPAPDESLKDSYGFPILAPKTMDEIKFICQKSTEYLELSDRSFLLNSYLDDIRKLIEVNKIQLSPLTDEIELEEDIIRELETKALQLSDYLLDASLLHQYRNSYSQEFRPPKPDVESLTLYEKYKYDKEYQVFGSSPDGSCFYNR